jgi:aminoglycoside phosphotransferase (APT) family kinase protein
MDSDEELGEATLRQMVTRIRPEWSLREATPAAEGTDVVYFVTAETPAGSREVVLKACEFLDPEAFRPEPYLMRLADRRTSIPVPNVFGAVDSAASETPRSEGGETAGVDHADLPAPFFLMEQCDGEVRENEARELPADAMERLARDAGRYLAELHALGEFEAFGPIRLSRDTDRQRGSLTVGERVLTTDEAAIDSWHARVEAMADGCLGDLPDRFGDLEADLRAFVDDHLDALDREFPPVLGHDDYRLGNLLVAPETGETRAVLDWGNAHTLEAQYNLVLTEQYLGGWAPHDDPLRERVRAALREGYSGVGELPDDADSERRRDLYLAVTRLFSLVWFSLWYGDQSESEREATAEKHRAAIRELVD